MGWFLWLILILAILYIIFYVIWSFIYFITLNTTSSVKDVVNASTTTPLAWAAIIIAGILLIFLIVGMISDSRGRNGNGYTYAATAPVVAAPASTVVAASPACPLVTSS